MVTSEQVARLAGVSRATVSRALNGSPRVSAEARKRIEEAIVSLGYEPDVVAQSLVRQRSRTIALGLFYGDQKSTVLSSISKTQHYFYLDLLRDVEQEIAAAQYDLLLPSISYAQKNYIRSLQMRHVAGTLAIAMHPADERVRALLEAEIPTVFIDSLNQGKSSTYVTSDNQDGARQATEHLIQLGHRRIVTLMSGTAGRIGPLRQAGYRQALQRVGLPIDEDLMYTSGWNTEEAYQATLLLLQERRPRDFTAIVVGSDLMAIGVLRALHQHGLHVPGDVSVVGFDDVDLCRYTEPPLTTIRQDRSAMVQGAVQRLIRMIESDGEYDESMLAPIIIPTRLITRASTGPVPESS
ncbi:LacI family DNA-binding transcriptional regulator [Dictyobacter aurantiacus]|uniref:LacI family transcriptional regulator n=1 Tax=Dictyobacter aurantiacus TaxID=1936993 RepID=A0A401ZNU2_9CHLR|nr:LacI family DNA-binding transcriptional regulator [Dictyobacter aurantiacus]GCE08578.1 LacI family transcriptional regulator [Dictyobacter aurantiacus]